MGYQISSITSIWSSTP